MNVLLPWWFLCFECIGTIAAFCAFVWWGVSYLLFCLFYATLWLFWFTTTMIIAWTNFPFCPSFPLPSLPAISFPSSFPSFVFLLHFSSVYDQPCCFCPLSFPSIPVLCSLAYGSQPCILSCSGSSSRSGPPSYCSPHGSGAASPGTSTPNTSWGLHHEPHPACSDGCHAAQWHSNLGASNTGRRAYLHHSLWVPLCPGTYLPAGIPHRAQWGSR